MSDLQARIARKQATFGIIGVRGMGGIGKTVIATALARDGTVRASFPDGVAWLRFGRDAPALTKAAELAAAITGQTIHFGSVDAARGQLGEMTQDLALLLVLDDVWEPEATDPFTGLGSKCRALITTQVAHVLTRVNAKRYDIGFLVPSEARDLLAATTGLPNASALPHEADAIIRHCGCLPLALAAAGRLVRKNIYNWADILQALEEGATEEFDTSWLPDPEQRSVAAVLRISVERLSREAKACFIACAAFRGGVDIPEAALLRLWSGTARNHRHAKQIAEELEERSLLMRDDHRHYRIHDLYFDYLHWAAAPLPARHGALVARYRRACQSDWDTCPDDGYIVRYLPWHLREAGQAAELRGLLFQFTWLQYKLSKTDINAVISDYTLLPDSAEGATLAAALTLSANVLAREPDQLAHQLYGRLFPTSGPTIARLLEELRSSCRLVPERSPYLTPPGTELRRFQGHTESINSIVALPDGHRALSHNASTLCLWDIETGAELRHFGGHTESVFSIVVLPDGRRALSASRDQTLRLWDIETGAELRRFRGHSAPVTAVAVLPDSRRTLSASGDQTLRLWDIETGAELRRFRGHSAPVTAVAVLPDSRHALSASWDGTVRLWDLETGAELRRFEGLSAPVTAVAVLPDSRHALWASWDGTVRLWDLETGAELRRFEGHSAPVNSIAMLPDGRRALSASQDQTLRLWDVETGAELRRFEGHTESVNSIAVLPDGRRALSASGDKTLRLWDIEARAQLRHLGNHIHAVSSLAVLQDGRRALSASWDETMRLWDLETGAELRRFEGHSGPVNSIAVLPDGHRALSASWDGTVRLWDLETGAELRRFEPETVRLWDAETGVELGRAVRGGPYLVYSVAVLPDGRRALSTHSDGRTSLWDVETGAELWRFEGHYLGAVLLDGRRALSAWADETLRLWDIETGAELRRFEGHTGSISSVAGLPDGRRALSASQDQTLRLWDVETGTELRRFEGHSGPVNSIAVLPDGHRALSASQDQTLRVWDVETGTRLDHYVGDVSFTALAPTRGGDCVLTGNALGQVVLFRLQT